MAVDMFCSTFPCNFTNPGMGGGFLPMILNIVASNNKQQNCIQKQKRNLYNNYVFLVTQTNL